MAVRSGELTESSKILENYAKSSNLLDYLKDINLVVSREGSPPATDFEGKENESAELEAIWKHLDKLYTFGEDGKIDGGNNPLVLAFNDAEFEAINSRELPVLSGGIVLVEFFTHCCINCLHSIEDVRDVYEEMKGQSDALQLKVISIHSPKFAREKNSESIKSFVEQMKMDYTTVVNDPTCKVWNELGISCWPTLLILGPNPTIGMNLLFTLMGEGHKSVLRCIISAMIPYFEKKIRCNGDIVDGSARVDLSPEMFEKIANENTWLTGLRFPGKVACFDDLLAIADTGNHRIIIADKNNGVVKHCIGGLDKGYSDGDFTCAKFSVPQGLAFRTIDSLFVADTGNHSLREVNLITKKVTTLVPPGWKYIHDNEAIHLRSPWDLAFYSEHILLCCAAGNHRIFAYFFEASKFFMSEYIASNFVAVAGTGREENRNNAYVMKASFSQPSGIYVMNIPESSKTIYVADSESSSIRSISTVGKGKVSSLIGATRDPSDLFAYGDIDGKGLTAKLQHPMGVCGHNGTAKLYVVDTYNNKVKIVDINTQYCSTLFVIGDPNSSKFNEPGGICIDEKEEIIYVADTNNHAIKSINLKNFLVSQLHLKFSNVKFDETFEVSAPENYLDFEFSITRIPENYDGGCWKLEYLTPIEPTQKNSPIVTGEMVLHDFRIASAFVKCPIDSSCNSDCNLTIDIYLCGKAVCYKRSLSFLFKIINTRQNCNQSSFEYEPKSDLFE